MITHHEFSSGPRAEGRNQTRVPILFRALCEIGWGFSPQSNPGHVGTDSYQVTGQFANRHRAHAGQVSRLLKPSTNWFIERSTAVCADPEVCAIESVANTASDSAMSIPASA